MPGVLSRGRAFFVGRMMRIRISRSEDGIILFSIVCNFRVAMFALRCSGVFCPAQYTVEEQRAQTRKPGRVFGRYNVS